MLHATHYTREKNRLSTKRAPLCEILHFPSPTARGAARQPPLPAAGERRKALPALDKIAKPCYPFENGGPRPPEGETTHEGTDAHRHPLYPALLPQDQRGELAAKYGCSERTIFRYVDELTCAGIPIDVSRGSGGGIYISDAYKLHRGLLTREEAARTREAMLAMNEQLRDPALTAAIRKFEAQYRTERVGPSSFGNILVDSGSWGDEHRFSDKLALIDRAIAEAEELAIDYVDREGDRSHRRIRPHLLVLKQNVWYVYAWCLMRKEFRLFKLGRIRTIRRTGETFRRTPVSREDIPLSFWPAEGKTVFARFAIAPEALPYVQDWLGVESIVTADGVHTAEAALPDDESLIGKILSAGAGLKVLSPASLKERVANEVRRLAAQYEA